MARLGSGFLRRLPRFLPSFAPFAYNVGGNIRQTSNARKAGHYNDLRGICSAGVRRIRNQKRDLYVLQGGAWNAAERLRRTHPEQTQKL
jgi:hypothetical protein